VFNEISKYVLENKVSKVVMGLPLTDDGKETEKSIEVRQFAKRLKTRIKKPVEFVTEHYSTKESLEELISNPLIFKKYDKVDHIAAGVILRNYYNKFT
jgi:putative Holliday junction resolvase